MLLTNPYYRYPPAIVSSAPTIIQQAHAASSSTAFASATTAGNSVLVVCAAPNCPSATFIPTVAGSTYSGAINILNFYNATAYSEIYAWYVPNAPSIPSGTQIGFDTSRYFNGLGTAIFELSPVNNTSPVSQVQSFLPVISTSPEVYDASTPIAANAGLGVTIWSQTDGAYNNSVATLPAGWTFAINSFNGVSNYYYIGIAISTVPASTGMNAVWNITNVDTNNRNAQAASFIIKS